jgi:hypothetical protein
MGLRIPTTSRGFRGQTLHMLRGTRGRDDVVDDPSAALLIRVWFEGAGEFRARLLTLRDATAETPPEAVTVAVASSPGGVLDAVRGWLDDFTRRPADRGDVDQ